MGRPWMISGALVLCAFGCRGTSLSPSGRSPAGPVRVVVPAADAGDAGGGDAGVAPAAVAFVAPDDGARFVQSDIVGGEWAAAVTFELSASGVDRVELLADGAFPLGAATGPSWTLSYDFFGTGERVIDAVGVDAAGVELARDTIGITIDPPASTSCRAMLDALGLDWAPASATRGIADPVRVQPVINGVTFRYISSAEPTAMLMDCELGVRLYRLTELLLPYGIDEVAHIGIYNYRCIGGGDPDSGTCTPSQHAYARAIDIGELGLAGSDAVYSLEADWEITTRADPCPIPSSSEPDRILKELACSMWSERVFQIVLTPNYNAAHRTHFHVDLTEGSMYIGGGVGGVDPVIGHLGD